MKNFFIPNSGNDHKPYLLRNGALLVYTLALFLFNSFSGLLGLPQVVASSITSQNIVNLTNEQREIYGLDRLVANSDLSAAALAKANNMFQQQYWDHFGPDGETPWQFIKDAGYKYVYAGENLAKGFKTAEGVVQAWLASPTHRDNLLSGNYKEIGVAAVSGELLGENVILVVQMFGNRTQDVSESVKPSIVTPDSEEEGDIKTIKIVSPDDGEVVNDAGLDISGEVGGVTGEYQVVITEGADEVGQTDSENEDWEFNKNGDWSEGEHIITASVENEEDVTDSVAFTIDSSAPKILQETLVVVKDNGVWNITVEIKDEAPSVSLVSGSKTFLITKDGEKYRAEIEDSQVGERTVIIASDKLGNTSELDISSMLEIREPATLVGSIQDFVTGMDVRSTFNILFAAFILSLLITEVYVYVKKGMLAKRAGNLFTIGIWWVLLVVGIVNGFSGVIS